MHDTRSAVKVQDWRSARVQKFAKLSIIQPGIARFRSNFVQTLITWRLMYHELSRLTGQISRSQLDITYQH